jgi:hypothetical protein
VNHNVDESLSNLLVDIETLVPLVGNPRRGNVDAIAASYAEFGQVKPVVIRPNDDGTATIIAGNHQVMAAKKLGWTHIAAVQMDADDSRAIAFALADNRTSELGKTDDSLVSELLGGVIDDYGDLFDRLGWDEFEIAAMEEESFMQERTTESRESQQYIPPVIQPIADIGEAILSSLVKKNSEGESQIVAPSTVEHKDVAVQGSGLVTNAMQVPSGPKAVVQYTIVFDDPEQQRRWYDFIRWLRNEAAYDGETNAEKLISFIDAHSEC